MLYILVLLLAAVVRARNTEIVRAAGRTIKIGHVFVFLAATFAPRASDPATRGTNVGGQQLQDSNSTRTTSDERARQNHVPLTSLTNFASTITHVRHFSHRTSVGARRPCARIHRTMSGCSHGGRGIRRVISPPRTRARRPYMLCSPIRLYRYTVLANCNAGIGEASFEPPLFFINVGNDGAYYFDIAVLIRQLLHALDAIANFIGNIPELGCPEVGKGHGRDLRYRSLAHAFRSNLCDGGTNPRTIRPGQYLPFLSL